MHVYFEENALTRSDCTVQSLSWMGKVPETLPDEDGWKLNRVHYYQEGWLASGNTRGIIGVTFTACHCRKSYEGPPRTNFNLRGHRNEVVLVKWNEPYQKLATCDVTGVIFVWIKHEGRWSIELINDRNSQVTDFAWSHDGRMALICYRDGFVLVGSVAGQRYWSSMLNLDGCMITCGIWSPDDQKVMFGTTDGQIIVMSSTGAMLVQVTVLEGAEISCMAWSCEKFYLDEQDNESSVDGREKRENRAYVLAVVFKSGMIYMMSNYDDVCPRIVHTGLTGLKIEWCNDGEILAVGGFVRLPNLECSNELRFFTTEGHPRYSLPVPHQGKPITALTWGHNNKRVFVAVGCHVYTAWVTKQVALLQFLCRRTIQMKLKDDADASKLPLPSKLRNSVAALFSPTIKGYIPDPLKLREFVCIPPPNNERLHCTMIRHGEDTSGGHYTLYLEYLGGLIPLLKGKRASKIRPEFVIFDPKIKNGGSPKQEEAETMFVSSESESSASDSDQDVVVEGCGSPRMQRKRRLKRLRERMERRDSTASQRPLDELLYDDNLPETNKLIEVTSNIWGTKFRIHGIASFLPEDLGQVLYKTSLLHLQPRQMTVSILELTNDLRPLPRDPNYNPNSFSESEDEMPVQATFQETLIDGILEAQDDIPISPDGFISHHPKMTNHSSTETVGTTMADSGAMEVPVIIERHTVFQSKVDKSSPLEIRSLEGSPPQRRSPSLKSRSLSPAEQVTFTSNTLVDGNLTDGIDGMFSREMYIEKGAIPKIKMNNNNYQVSSSSNNCESEADTNHDVCNPTSARSVVQLAAKKLEDVIQRHGCRDNGMLPVVVSSSEDGCHQGPSRWADKACHEIRYIDDDNEMDTIDQQRDRDTVVCTVDGGNMTAREIMTSTQMLNDLDQATRTSASCSDTAKRLVLAPPPDTKKGKGKSECRGHHRGASMEFLLRSDSPYATSDAESSVSNSPQTSVPSSPVLGDRRGSLDVKRVASKNEASKKGGAETVQSASVPTSPVRRIVKPNHKRAHSKQDLSLSKIKMSPLSRRKMKNSCKAVDSSDEEVLLSGDEVLMTSANYKNLETFQKAQLTKKLRKVRTKTEVERERGNGNGSSGTTHKRQFVMHNKAPLWNENSQVYQLDFGGRVTQESAKNFQIEFRGKQVMQFGRIDSNAYTLDFQYPFCAIQAFAVALANVTQRLK